MTDHGRPETTRRRTLLRGALVHTGDPSRRHTAVALQHGRVVGTGDEAWAAAYDGADEVVDLAGRWVAPAFVDAHVHTVATGFLRTQLDLTATHSLRACLDSIAQTHHRQQAAGESGPDHVLMGSGWDESGWPEGRAPTGAELERAAPGRLTYAARIDGHSAVVSPALAAAVPGLGRLVGAHADGLVEREAYAAVNRTLGTLVGPAQRLAAARAATADMARHGIAGFHENAAPHLGPASEMDLVRQAAEEVGLLATLYWGELDAFETLSAHGAVGLAGDLNADGAIGSCTAAMTAAYTATPDHGGDHAADHRGHEFLTVAQVAAHVVACTLAGVQAGFHCIGDAALEVVADGLQQAADRLGVDRVRAARHRLEHVEMPSPRVQRLLARLRVTASVQPVFDALWGGAGGMYEQRLGDRWQAMNPFADLAAAGVPLALGSDGPVTPMGPWAAVTAAVRHHRREQGLTPAAAFAAHTLGGWQAARIDDAGTLSPGAAAHLAVWDVAPPLSADSAWLPTCLDPSGGPAPSCAQLWVMGRAVLGDAPALERP